MLNFHSLSVVFSALSLIVAAPTVLAQPVDFSAEERAAGEAVILATARYFMATSRESSSLSFRNVHLGKRPVPSPNSKVVVCGEVNGRNGFGGFTGYQPFMASGTRVYVGRVAGLSVFEACHSERVFDGKDYSAELTAAVASTH